MYAPSSGTTSSKLPVYVFIQGGGFNYNSQPNYDGNSLIKASGGKIIIVTFNYRVGVYGFLASKEVQAAGNANVGLLDQRKCFQWVQKYITLVRNPISQQIIPLTRLMICIVWWRPSSCHDWRSLCRRCIDHTPSCCLWRS